MNNEEKYCHYSDLPSPSAYIDDTMDYDGMGNHGRFPKPKDKPKTMISKIINKFLLVIKPKHK